MSDDLCKPRIIFIEKKFKFLKAEDFEWLSKFNKIIIIL